MIWKTRRVLIDVETGEIINESDLNNYIIIRKIKSANANRTTGKGVVTYTIECRQRERIQGNLFGQGNI